MKSKSTIAGVVLAGLATGAAAWYLFGTSKGRETYSKLLGSVKDMDASLVDKARETFSSLSSKAHDISGKAMA